MVRSKKLVAGDAPRVALLHLKGVLLLDPHLNHPLGRLARACRSLLGDLVVGAVQPGATHAQEAFVLVKE